MTKPLRLAMPWTAAIIDDFRAEFPEAGIEKSVRAGLDGQPTFWARENGNEIGTRAPYSAERAVKLSDIQVGPFNATAAHAASRKGK